MFSGDSDSDSSQSDIETPEPLQQGVDDQDPLTRAQAEPLFEDDFDEDEPDVLEWQHENLTPKNANTVCDLAQGAKKRFNPDTPLLDFFSVIWGDDIWQMIVDETNRCVYIHVHIKIASTVNPLNFV